MTAARPVVHVVDDDASFRTAVGRLLTAAGFAVKEHASAAEFLEAGRGDVPACVLLDVRMPGPSGLDLQQELSRREGMPPIVFLTGHGDIAMSVRAIKSGAEDFLTKPVEGRELIAAVRGALARDAQNHEVGEALRVLRSRYETLTVREREVLAHVVAGRLNKQIAATVHTSERTVKAHRARVMQKMGAGSVADLVRAAARLGIR